MALSYSSVEKAYKIFHELGVKNIPSWPEDMSQLSSRRKIDPDLDTVYGWDKKSDDGWENLFFLRKDPDPEFIKEFKRLAPVVPNSSMCEPYKFNDDLWLFGWF